MPRVSIVMPTRNRRRLIRRALASVAAQTYRDYELLIIDDASTDETERTIRDVVPTLGIPNSRFHYVRVKDRRGASAARNLGIRLARGEYLAFLDSDDVWHPAKLDSQLGALGSSSKPSLICCGRYRVDSDLAVLRKQTPPSSAAAEIRAGNGIGPLSSVVVSADPVRHIGGFDEALPAAQDWDLYIRVLPFAQFVCVPEPLLLYVDGHGEQITGDARSRLRGHLALARRHRLCGEASRIHLLIAEDLYALGRRRSASRFLAKWGGGGVVQQQWRRLHWALVGPREQRYRRYRSAERRRLASVGERERDHAWLADYQRVVSLAR